MNNTQSGKRCFIISILSGWILLSFSPGRSVSATASRAVTDEFVEKCSKNISAEFVETDIASALRMLAKTSGVNIVAGEKITGKVSARLVDVPLEEALSTILKSCGYGFICEGEVLRVVKIEDELIGIDGSTPQVLIESRIVEVTLGEDNQTGVNWEFISSKIVDDISVEGIVDLSPATSGLLMNIYNGDVDALIQMIEKESKTDILSAPRVVALDGMEARILVGEKVAYQQTFGQASAGITTTSVNFEDVGIKLYVTPHVRSGGAIIVDVLVEVSSVKEWRKISNGDEIPIISTKQTTSRVVIDDNSTLIIGGLIGESKIESIWKIPVLGDIPFLKYLFSRRAIESNKTELNVFITPRLVGSAPVSNTHTAGTGKGYKCNRSNIIIPGKYRNRPCR